MLRHMRCTHLSRILILPLVVLAGGSTGRGQQASSNLAITSPSNGLVVEPGASITVIVSVTPGNSFDAVGIIGEDIGFGPSTITPPYTFSLIIPNAPNGFKKITAYGITGVGTGVFSVPVTIDIENDITLTALNATPRTVDFKFAGEQIPMTLIGVVEDGSVVDMTRSSRTIYRSNDTTVATVDSDGKVTAVGQGRTGTTTITLTHGIKSLTIPVSVQRPIPFATFRAEADIRLAQPSRFEVDGTFTLGTGSDGINPSAEPVTLRVGSLAIMIAPHSFVQDKMGRFEFQGTVNGVALEFEISPVSGREFRLTAEGQVTKLSGAVKALVVGLSIGDDDGSEVVKATLE